MDRVKMDKVDLIARILYQLKASWLYDLTRWGAKVSTSMEHYKDCYLFPVDEIDKWNTNNIGYESWVALSVEEKEAMRKEAINIITMIGG